ncbi:hypothetical protein CMUS01_13924 [Colletotrichum musicola]|uniref:Uncharacterized protein n=1 Tax=Colletotrichum musicola TaxID=2175873 RepID=A0A8H6J964_9PEZI|nr:hypothetical protein CMUS01_13924 [Colletotrichum musicola]
MRSIRSFDLCTPRYELFREGEGVPLWIRDTDARNTYMAAALCDFLHRCQATLQELSIDTRWEAAAATPIAQRITALAKVPPPHFKERWELRFERLRDLHLRNARDDCGALDLALFPACPNLDTLRPSGSMAASLAVDLELYSSVKYLIIPENPTGGYYTSRAIGAIVGRFANLESLMIDFDLAPSERAAVHRLRCKIEQCASLKQLALTPWNPFADDTADDDTTGDDTTGNDIVGDGTMGDDTMGDDTTDDNTTDGETVEDVFNMRLIHSSHALARFQHRPGRGGNDGAEGWDRKYEFSDKLRWPIGED